MIEFLIFIILAPLVSYWAYNRPPLKSSGTTDPIKLGMPIKHTKQDGIFGDYYSWYELSSGKYKSAPFKDCKRLWRRNEFISNLDAKKKE